MDAVWLHRVSVAGFSIAVFAVVATFLQGPGMPLLVLPLALAAYHGVLGAVGALAGLVAIVTSSIAARRGDTRWSGVTAVMLLVATLCSGCLGVGGQIHLTSFYVSAHDGVTTLEYANDFDGVYYHHHCRLLVCVRSNDRTSAFRAVGG